jgi:hypothetical protein
MARLARPILFGIAIGWSAMTLATAFRGTEAESGNPACTESASCVKCLDNGCTNWGGTYGVVQIGSWTEQRCHDWDSIEPGHCLNTTIRQWEIWDGIELIEVCYTADCCPTWTPGSAACSNPRKCP